MSAVLSHPHIPALLTQSLQKLSSGDNSSSADKPCSEQQAPNATHNICRTAAKRTTVAGRVVGDPFCVYSAVCATCCRYLVIYAYVYIYTQSLEKEVAVKQ